MSLILSGTDGLSDVDGSAATPAIRGTDTNTGIFFPAADTIAFSEGGVEAARFDSAGNLGIGTTSPGERLNVVGGGATTSTVNVTGGNNNDNATISSDYSLNFQVDANNNIGGRDFNWRYGGKGYSDGTLLMTLNSSGNLGLGVTPSANSLAGSGYKALEVGGAPGFGLYNGGLESYLLANAYFNSGFKYANSSAASYYYQTAGAHAWFRAPSGTAGNAITFTQAMTLDASGNLLVGTASKLTGGVSGLDLNLSSSCGITFAVSGSNRGYLYAWTAGSQMRWESVSGHTIAVVSGGSGGVSLANGATSWASLSDERTKTDLAPITNAVEKVASLRSVTGRFKTDAPEIRRAFLIAQDLQAVLPEAVTPYQVKDDDTEYLGLAYTDVIPLLTAAIQEQQVLIQEIKAELAALKGEA
jgi:hypothetical protein